ncbi:Yippee/Mis18 [Phycomyces nitens]|nr:Yippee/Mis18 [Phycomyces nitens]
MGLKYRTYLDGKTIYGCKSCKTHLSTAEAVESEDFSGLHGPAFLCLYAVNVVQGPDEERSMSTGTHIVRSISCCKCKIVLGWTYIKAFKEENKYKEGKFILERMLIVDLC